MKYKTNILAFLGTLMIVTGFLFWLGVSYILGYIFAVPGFILFLVGAVQDYERDRA